MVETSARHVHVSEADLKTLFGADAKLTVKKELSQPGQYASNEKVEVIGPKGSLVMSILGPTRPETQVEVALTDARISTLQISSNAARRKTATPCRRNRKPAWTGCAIKPPCCVRRSSYASAASPPCASSNPISRSHASTDSFSKKATST